MSIVYRGSLPQIFRTIVIDLKQSAPPTTSVSSCVVLNTLHVQWPLTTWHDKFSSKWGLQAWMARVLGRGNWKCLCFAPYRLGKLNRCQIVVWSIVICSVHHSSDCTTTLTHCHWTVLLRSAHSSVVRDWIHSTHWSREGKRESSLPNWKSTSTMPYSKGMFRVRGERSCEKMSVRAASSYVALKLTRWASRLVALRILACCSRHTGCLHSLMLRLPFCTDAHDLLTECVCVCVFLFSKQVCVKPLPSPFTPPPPPFSSLHFSLIAKGPMPWPPDRLSVLFISNRSPPSWEPLVSTRLN